MKDNLRGDTLITEQDTSGCINLSYFEGWLHNLLYKKILLLLLPLPLLLLLLLLSFVNEPYSFALGDFWCILTILKKDI